MRKTLGLLCATALMLPVGVIAASAASGVVPGPVCTKTAGTATFNPPLPDLSSKKTVKGTLTAKGSLSGCKGGGVTAGRIVFKSVKGTTGANCTTLSHPKTSDKPTHGTFTITWNNKKVSTAKVFNIKQTKSVVDATTTGRITAGLFKGKTIRATVTYKLPKNACAKGHPLKTVTYVNKKGTKFTIK